MWSSDWLLLSVSVYLPQGTSKEVAKVQDDSRVVVPHTIDNHSVEPDTVWDQIPMAATV